MSRENAFDNDVEIQWCPGCPNLNILQALKSALTKLGKEPSEICLVSGIGQAAKLPHYLRCNFFNGLHGRALSAAAGISAANPDLTIIVTTGEGDCYAEGGNHFIHALRRNVDITVLVHNNEIYALTKGQASPTTRPGEIRAVQFYGVEHATLNMPAIAVAHNCGFVARGFAGDREQMEYLIMEAVGHRGFSFVEILQPCITWHTHPMQWYKDRIEKIDDSHDPADKRAALELVLSTKETYLTGIIYRSKEREIFGARYREDIAGGPLAKAPFLDSETIAREIQKFR